MEQQLIFFVLSSSLYPVTHASIWLALCQHYSSHWGDGYKIDKNPYPQGSYIPEGNQTTNISTLCEQVNYVVCPKEVWWGKQGREGEQRVLGVGAGAIFSLQSRLKGVMGKKTAWWHGTFEGGGEHYTSGKEERALGMSEMYQAHTFFAFCFSPGCSKSKVNLAVTDENIAQRPSKAAEAAEEVSLCVKMGTSLSLLLTSQGSCEDQRREWLWRCFENNESSPRWQSSTLLLQNCVRTSEVTLPVSKHY